MLNILEARIEAARIATDLFNAQQRLRKLDAEIGSVKEDVKRAEADINAVKSVVFSP